MESKRNLKYNQVFKNNLDVIEKPTITKCKGKAYTKVVFKPDYKRLGINGLSKDIVLDGEGSTKICKIIVKGAKNSRDSKRIARNIANSLLFKTALFGSDPNWGRIISAVGSTQIKYIDQNSIDIYIGDKLVVKNGLGLKLSKKINQIMRKKEIKIIIDLKKGKYESFMLTNDIGHEYIKINSLYTT